MVFDWFENKNYFNKKNSEYTVLLVKQIHTYQLSIVYGKVHILELQIQNPLMGLECVLMNNYHIMLGHNDGNGVVSNQIDVGPSWLSDSRKMVVHSSETTQDNL